jgi:hypothetical protein
MTTIVYSGAFGGAGKEGYRVTPDVEAKERAAFTRC